MNIELWKKRKKELKMTHDELAEKSGVSRRTIAGIFSGNPDWCSPTLNTIQAIERALGLDEEPKNSVQIPDKYKDIMVALNDGDKNLQQEDIDAIVRFIEFTKNK